MVVVDVQDARLAAGVVPVVRGFQLGDGQGASPLVQVQVLAGDAAFAIHFRDEPVVLPQVVAVRLPIALVHGLAHALAQAVVAVAGDGPVLVVADALELSCFGVGVAVQCVLDGAALAVALHGRWC